MPARKRFGQHFLHDPSVVQEILRAIQPVATDCVVEIGPGRGALTGPLLQRVERLIAVELDRDLARELRLAWPPERLQLVQADALAVDFGALTDHRLRIVGNLPYNISTPLLFHLMRWADQVRDQHFMLQREVVDRMVAAPGTAQYGRLSIMLQARYRMARLFDVPAQAFDPPPRVVSAFVRMRPLPADAMRQPHDAVLFEEIVAQAFGQRRKMLRHSLGDRVGRLDWQAVGVAPTARPQELSVAQFMDLADALAPAVAGDGT